ncbi:MAG: ABC transporter substrate-binding protein, partial [Nitrospinota bacterium]
MFPLLAAVCAALAFAFGAFGTPLDAQAAKRGGTLRVAVEGEAFDLDVIGISGALKVYREIMSAALLRLDENFNVVGDLAQSWEVSDEGRVVTFKLHPGGTFHDGTPLDAEAVKWNLDMISRKVLPKWVQEREAKNPQYKWRNIFENYLYHLEKVEVVDKYTLRIHQKDIGKAQIFDDMTGTLGRFVLVSPKAYDMDIERFRRHPALAGPYKFVEWKRNQHLIAERHEGYFKKGLGLPHLDRLEFYFIPDANQRMNALIAGQIDVINNLPLSLYEAMRKVPGVTVHRGRATINYAFPFHNQLPLWKDIRVRKAVSCYGVDRALIVQTALRGLAKPWVSFAPGGAVDALDLTAECPYDPERAKKLLAEAGYGPGKPL